MNIKISLLIGTIAFVMIACKGEKKNDKSINTQETAIPVRAQPLQQQTIALPVVASGLLASQTEVKLAFKTGGIIEQIYTKEGQTVTRGQLLAKLNMAEIEAQVAQARIALNKADRDLVRAKNLYRDSVATLEQVQNATTGQEISTNSVKIAEFNQKYSTIYAPITGRVIRQFAEAGELINTGSPILTIASTEQAFVVKVGLTDREIVRVKLGDAAEISMDAYPNKTFKAYVSQIAQTASPTTGTYEVELQVENPQNLTLIAGFVAKATISPQDNTLYTVIPIAALVEADGEKGFIYVLDENKVHKKAVKILHITTKNIAIETDLPIKTQIIVEGAGYLIDKAKVSVMR